MIEEIKVGAEGQAFIEQSLSEGHTLAQTVTRFQQIEHTTIVALLPSQVTPETVINFESGFTGVRGAWEYLGGRILQYVKEEGHIVVVEDIYSIASDERRYRPSGQTILFYEQDVYHVIDGTYSDIDSIVYTLNHWLLRCATQIHCFT
jgi:hypothetical protein